MRQYIIKKSIGAFLLVSLIAITLRAQTETTTTKPAPKPIVYNTIGVTSTPSQGPVTMELVARFQHRVQATKNPNDHFDVNINSPKSVNYLPGKKKFYVQSLEGNETIVYEMGTFKKLKVIAHKFGPQNQNLFKDGEYKIFDYKYRFRQSNFNTFTGKPVESCFSHNNKYLWVTYYKRSYDHNAQEPSAVAIIDTDKDEIIRVMPTGILPKMIAASPDGRFIAVTHWGDNTVGIIDIQSTDPMQFKYINLVAVGSRLYPSFGQYEKVDRDFNCGFCLRGTVFTGDSKHLLVGRMGGGGIAMFDVDADFKYLGVTFTEFHNIRHLVVFGDDLFISTNSNGYVQKIPWREFVRHRVDNAGTTTTLKAGFKNCYIGPGVRTIVVSSDGRYIFGCVNEGSKIVAVDVQTMKPVASIPADSFPVGMEISDDNEYLIVTAQGKATRGGGHSVMVYKLKYSSL